MAYTFTENDRKEVGVYFQEGVHKVTIQGAISGQTQDGKDFVEISIAGESGEEEAVRLFFTDKAARYSLNTIRSIFVHNAKPEGKDKVRDAVNAAKDTLALDKFYPKLAGAECWYQLSQSDRTYTNAQGEVKNSYDRNLYAYEPKPRAATPKQEAKAMVDAGEPENISAEEFPF